MPQLNDLFMIENGIQVSELDIEERPRREKYIPVLRPSNSFRKLIIGYAGLSEVLQNKVFQSNSLIVSTNGEGSHTYSYVIPFQFLPNSDVSVLIPKKEMTIKEKLFYSLAITSCRWRFSYGRKPKGERLGKLELPILPSWLNECDIPNFDSELKNIKKIEDKLVSFDKSNLCVLSELFNIHYGYSYELNHLEQTENGIAYVSRTSLNNGISAYVIRTKDEPTPAGCITVALGGSVLETFLQNEPSYQGRDVAILTEIKKMTKSEKLWYVTMIKQHQFRFSYGRQANRQLPYLRVPKCPKSIAEIED